MITPKLRMLIGSVTLYVKLTVVTSKKNTEFEEGIVPVV